MNTWLQNRSLLHVFCYPVHCWEEGKTTLGGRASTIRPAVDVGLMRAAQAQVDLKKQFVFCEWAVGKNNITRKSFPKL